MSGVSGVGRAGDFGPLLTDFERDAKFWSQQLVTAAVGRSTKLESQHFTRNARRGVTQLPSNTNCVRDVALHVWGELGFFTVPPLEEEQVDLRACRPRECNGEKKASAPDEDVLKFVSALEGHYTQILKGGEMTLDDEDGQTCKKVQGVGLPQQLRCHELRNGVWRVLFNAVFYCVAASGNQVLFPSLEEASPSDASARSNSITSCDNGDERQSRLGEGSDEERSDQTVVFPIKLQWRSYQTVNEAVRGANQRGQRGRVSSSVDISESPAPQELPTPLKTATTSMFRQPRRQEDSTRPLRGTKVSFASMLQNPLPIIAWRFILHTLSQLGYRRDAFYVQTPLHASLDELMLALLWLTREYQLVATAEHVNIHFAYPFLLEWCRNRDEYEKKGGFGEISPTLSGTVGSLGEGFSTKCGSTDVAKQHYGDVLLHSFPAAVPWPPASFLEQEGIAYRLHQQARIIPAAGGELTDTPRGPVDLSRQLLSVRRLIELSVSRLEHVLHQRAEQISAMGLHSDLDLQLCHPAIHDTYCRLCCGLRHMLGLEKRLRDVTEQLARFGSLVAWSLSHVNRCGDGCCVYDDLRNAKGVVEAMENDEVEASSASSLPSNYPLQNAFNSFRATHRLEQLHEMSAFFRRSAKVNNSRTPQDDVALRTKVQHNMKARYSLKAALSAELMAMVEANNSGCRGSGHDATSLKSRMPLLRSFDLATTPVNTRSGNDTCSDQTDTGSAFAGASIDAFIAFHSTRRAQAAVVGTPASGGTTSARLEVERLREVKRQLPTGHETCEEVGQLLNAATRTLHHHKLRIVPPISKAQPCL
ncbi:hypothetical protein DPX39_100020100 [Trypanosoma brucei equiperdum]|uniref:Uncharacterized protein n=1 Tax=Trypanosoma brucei equiperdum TaxID=630700 RepID=A0A3L6L2A0_9TRYP|nr:hypothetical protein DPX39_100020100 [Trypanosoma brucei equiperdum]